MVNMNLLSNIYNLDNIEISNVNRKYIALITIFIVVITISLLLTKNIYLENSFTVMEDKLLLVTDNVNVIKDNNKIIINDIKYDYSIDKIEQYDNNYLVTVIINNMINNINQGNYKIYLGKERIIDYIIRIIKK